jgi:hypothetical protein
MKINIAIIAFYAVLMVAGFLIEVYFKSWMMIYAITFLAILLLTAAVIAGIPNMIYHFFKRK